MTTKLNDKEYNNEVSKWMQGRPADENLIILGIQARATMYVHRHYSGVASCDRDALCHDTTSRIWETLHRRRQRGVTTPPSGYDWAHWTFAVARDAASKSPIGAMSRHEREARRLLRDVQDEIEAGELRNVDPVREAKKRSHNIGDQYWTHAQTTSLDSALLQSVEWATQDIWSSPVEQALEQEMAGDVDRAVEIVTQLRSAHRLRDLPDDVQAMLAREGLLDVVIELQAQEQRDEEQRLEHAHRALEMTVSTSQPTLDLDLGL